MSDDFKEIVEMAVVYALMLGLVALTVLFARWMGWSV